MSDKIKHETQKEIDWSETYVFMSRKVEALTQTVIHGLLVLIAFISFLFVLLSILLETGWNRIFCYEKNSDTRSRDEEQEEQEKRQERQEQEEQEKQEEREKQGKQEKKDAIGSVILSSPVVRRNTFGRPPRHPGSRLRSFE